MERLITVKDNAPLTGICQAMVEMGKVVPFREPGQKKYLAMVMGVNRGSEVINLTFSQD